MQLDAFSLALYNECSLIYISYRFGINLSFDLTCFGYGRLYEYEPVWYSKLKTYSLNNNKDDDYNNK